MTAYGLEHNLGCPWDPPLSFTHEIVYLPYVTLDHLHVRVWKIKFCWYTRFFITLIVSCSIMNLNCASSVRYIKYISYNSYNSWLVVHVIIWGSYSYTAVSCELTKCPGTGAIVCSVVLMISGSVLSPTSFHVTRLARTPRRWERAAAVVVSIYPYIANTVNYRVNQRVTYFNRVSDAGILKGIDRKFNYV